MMINRSQRNAHRLLALFEKERTALCSAELDRVAEMGQRKLELISALEKQPPDLSTTRKIRKAADRNARLLAAAIQGLHDGAGQLRTILQATSGFNTYDSAGRGGVVGGSKQPSNEHRA